MTDEVDHTAGHLRELIEKVRLYGRSKPLFEAADEAEEFLNRPAE